MQDSQDKCTGDLIREARETCRRTREIVEELNRLREEVEWTVSHAKWWRFLGYDLDSLDFLEKLDVGH